jgi:SAM-dependent methyltransferase
MPWLAATAIEAAKRKAQERGVAAHFLVWNALDLASLGQQFDTVLDSGLFHVLDDSDRRSYVDNLKAVIPPGGRYFMLCFSDRQPGGFGPRRINQEEIRASFAEGWRVDAIDPVTLDNTAGPGIFAWRARITRMWAAALLIDREQYRWREGLFSPAILRGAPIRRSHPSASG